MAPHMPHNNVLLNPNMQVALLAVILASQIQQVLYTFRLIVQTQRIK